MFPTDMPQGFCNHLIQKLVCKFKFQSSVIQSGNGKQILHNSDQPFRIIIDIAINLMFCSFVQTVTIAKQHICISGNGAKRRTKIMRNRPKKICPQLFIFGHNCIFFLFQCIFRIFHCKRTFIYYRQQDAVFKRVQCFFLQWYPDHTINIIPTPDCQI